MGSGRTGRAVASADVTLLGDKTWTKLSGMRTDGPMDWPADSVFEREVSEQRGSEEEEGAIMELRRGDEPWTPRVRLSSRESILACEEKREIN